MNFLTTMYWVAMDMIGALILFDSFARRRKTRLWGLWVGAILLFSTVYLLVVPSSFFWKMVLLIPEYIGLYTVSFRDDGGPLFRVCLALIHHGISCNMDNLVAAFLFARVDPGWSFGQADGQSFLLGGVAYLLSWLVEIVLHLSRRHCKAQAASWRWYVFPATLSMLTVGMIYYLGGLYSDSGLSAQGLFACAVFLALVDLLSVVLVSWMEQNAHDRREALNLHTQVRAQAQGIEALNDSYAAQRRLTHDFRAHLAVLAQLLENGESGKAAAYVTRLQQTQSERILPVNTHNGMMDALLNQKAGAARKSGADIQFEVNDLSALNIDPPDLTVLLSNLLDNAIEAGLTLPGQERRIQVKALLDGKEFFFSVRNRSRPVTVPRGGLPASTKEDPDLHGYGLQNVVTILHKYRALYDLHWEDGWFQFVTELPNTLPVGREGPKTE